MKKEENTHKKFLRRKCFFMAYQIIVGALIFAMAILAFLGMISLFKHS